MQNLMKQWKSDFQKLADALQSGDISAAQAAFSDLQQLKNNAPKPPSDSSTNTIDDDFTALSKALQSGDLDAAKKAFAKLQKDMEAFRTSHHRPPQDSDNEVTQDSTNTDSSSNTSSSSDNLA
jgi:soluble cytochrome b562